MNIYKNKDILDLPKEKWAAVPCSDDKLMISNMGRIKRIAKTKDSYTAQYVKYKKKPFTPFIMAQHIGKQGYLLFKCDNYRTRKVHRIVGEAFIPNPEKTHN